jgi:hypothetical protein
MSSFRVRNNQTILISSSSNPPNYWTPDNSGNIVNNNSGNVKVSGNFEVDTNTLFVDASNNKVGILSTTPQNTLDVNGTLCVRNDNVAKILLLGFGGTPYKTGAYSMDGVNFIASNSTGADNLRCAVYSPEHKLWVLGGGSANGAVSKSYSYDGINWTNSPDPSGNFMRNVIGIAYSSYQRRFVIVGGRISTGSTTTVGYSNDGINWLAGSPTNSFGVEGRGVCYSPTLDKWVATGRDSTRDSSNGINWTLRSSTIVGNSVAWMGGTVNKFIIANNINSTNTLATSTDGSGWTGLGNTFFTSSASYVAVNSSNTLAVVVGSGTNGGLAYTTDASNFTFVSGLPSSAYSTVTYSNYYNAWFAGNASTVITSVDGITWSSLPVSPTLLTAQFGIAAYQNPEGYVPSSLKISCDLSANALMQDFNKLDISGNTNIIGNVGIGTITPSSSAILDLSSTSKGFLPPRMTGAQANAITPVDGLMVYISDSATAPFTTGPGFFGRIAGSWQKL